MTFEWVRDHYDTNKNRYIDQNELQVAEDDFYHNETINEEELGAVYDAYDKHTLLPAYGAPPSAKGELRNVSYPPTATNGTVIDVQCRVYNSGGAAGTFKVALYQGAKRVSQTSTWYQSANTTTGIKTVSTTVPGMGTSVSYMLKCIRVT